MTLVILLFAGSSPAQDAETPASNPVVEAARQGIILDRTGRYAEALPLLEGSYPQLVANLPAGDRWRLNTAHALAHALIWLDRRDEAITLLSEADAAIVAAGADAAEDAPDIAYALALALDRAGRVSEAQIAARRACALWAAPGRNADPALCARLDPVLARTEAQPPPVRWTSPERETAFNTALQTAMDASTANRHDEADRAVLEAIRIEAAESDASELERAKTLEVRTAVLMQAGRWSQSAAVWAAIIEVRRRLLGPLHPDTVEAIGRLGQAYEQTEDYSKAETVYTDWLADADADAEGAQGPNAVAAALPLGALGALYRLTGQEAKAEPLWRRTLAIYEDMGEGDGAGAAIARSNLALSIQTQGRNVEAEPMLRQALDWTRTHPDADPTLPILVASNLAFNLTNQGRVQEAEILLRMALALPPGPRVYDRRMRGVVYSNLAVALISLGRLAEADAVLTEGIAAFGQGFDPAQSRTLRANLAALRTAQGRGDEAEEILRTVAAESESALGLYHADTALALSSTATTLEARGRTGGAEIYYRRALAAATAALGPDHPTSRLLALNLANNLLTQDRLTEAGPMFQAAVEGMQARPEDPLRPFALTGLAMVRAETEGPAEAEPLLREALALRRARLGDGATDTGESWKALAANLGAQEKFGEAREAAARAVTIYDAALAPGHPDRLEMALILAATEERSGSPGDALERLRHAQSDYLVRAGGMALGGHAAQSEVEQVRPLFRRSVRVAWAVAH